MLSVLHIKDPDLHLDSQVLFQFLITNDNKITTLQVSKLSLIKTYIGSWNFSFYCKCIVKFYWQKVLRPHMEIFCMVHVYGCKVWRENTNRFWVHVHCIRYFVHPLRIHVFSIGLYKTQNYSRLSFQANDFFYSLYSHSVGWGMGV